MKREMTAEEKKEYAEKGFEAWPEELAQTPRNFAIMRFGFVAGAIEGYSAAQENRGVLNFEEWFEDFAGQPTDLSNWMETVLNLPSEQAVIREGEGV